MEKVCEQKTEADWSQTWSLINKKRLRVRVRATNRSSLLDLHKAGMVYKVTLKSLDLQQSTVVLQTEII